MMTAKQHVILAILFGAFAASQAVVGYDFDRHDQTGPAVTFYVIAVIGLALALRAWGRRKYYP